MLSSQESPYSFWKLHTSQAILFVFKNETFASVLEVFASSFPSLCQEVLYPKPVVSVFSHRKSHGVSGEIVCHLSEI